MKLYITKALAKEVLYAPIIVDGSERNDYALVGEMHIVNMVNDHALTQAEKDALVNAGGEVAPDDPPGGIPPIA